MRDVAAHEQAATNYLHDQLKSSRLGQRWERMVRLHAHELEAVLAVDPKARADVATALTLLAGGGPLGGEITDAVERVLVALQRGASVPLQRDITRLRDELALARGYTLAEVLID